MSQKDEKMTSVEELLAYIEGCEDDNDQSSIKSTKKQKKRQKKVVVLFNCSIVILLIFRRMSHLFLMQILDLQALDSFNQVISFFIIFTLTLILLNLQEKVFIIGSDNLCMSHTYSF